MAVRVTAIVVDLGDTIMNQNKIGFYVTSALAVLALLSSTLFVVDQRQFGVVYSFGQIKSVITEPGLNIK